MNMFYSEAKNSKFPFFLQKLVGEVISANQQNIKFIADLIKNKRFSIKYENIDSLYFICLKEYF